MKDKSFENIKNRISNTYSITPNDLYSEKITFIYKLLTKPLKSFPFRIYLPISIIAVVFSLILFRFLIIRLVSLMQYGF